MTWRSQVLKTKGGVRKCGDTSTLSVTPHFWTWTYGVVGSRSREAQPIWSRRLARGPARPSTSIYQRL